MFRFLILQIATILILTSTASAQTATGILQGRVADDSGAAVPDAKVSIENERTSVRQVTTSNSLGNFIQPYLLPSTYKVTVEKVGFQKYSTSGITVEVQKSTELDVILTIGEVTTTVEVSASAAQLATTTATVSATVDNKKVLDLPLNGRNPMALANLVPGVIQGSSNSGYAGWISGGRNSNTEVTVDGTSIVLPENNVSIQQLALTPLVDSIEEFTVITNALAPEIGRTAGGAFNISTRSGTNQIHGTGFEFLRNSALNANTWSNNRNGVKKTQSKNHQFGGTLGGPLVIPHLYDGRNKTFWFFSEQSDRNRNAATGTATVPIEAWRNGDFSDLKNGNGQPVIIYDPATVTPQVDASGVTYFTRQPLPGNRVPAGRIMSFAKALLGYWPQPNATPTNPYTQTNNFYAAGGASSRVDQFDIRLDHNFSDKFKVWGRGSYKMNESTPFNGFANIATSIGSSTSHNDSYAETATAVYTLNPSTIFQSTYGFTRFSFQGYAISRGFDIRTIGFPQYMYDAAVTQGLEFPDINVGGVSKLGQATFTTLLQAPSSHNLRFDVTKVLSQHTIKAGFQYNKLFMNFTQLGQPDGSFTFGDTFVKADSRASSVSTIGFGFASFLLGLATSGNQEHTFSASTASSYFGFYVQDDWKVSQKLTINYGIRWDTDLPHTERYNRLSYFDYDAPSPLAGKVPGFPNLHGAMRFVTPDHRRQTPTVLHNWGPRFGFAYKLNQKTVFRGAYGILYGVSVMQAAGVSGSSGTEGFRGSTQFTASVDGGGVPFATMSNPFPLGLNLPLGAKEGPTSGALTNIGAGIGESFFNDWVTPMGQQWNGTLQRELPGRWLVEAGYLGSKWQHLNDGESSMAYNQLPPSYLALGNQLLSTNRVPNPFYNVLPNHPQPLFNQPLVVYSQLLRPFPQYTSVSAFRKPQGNSLYHSFTLGATKRFSKGLSAQISLTAGKLIDDVSQTVTFLGQAGTKQDFYNRHAERSISSQDISKRLVVSADYELPIGRNRQFLGGIPRYADFVVGGWQVNGIAVFQTGLPLAINNGQNLVGLGNPGQRPNTNGKNPQLDGPISQRLDRYFDTSVFSQTGNFQFGNVSRFVGNLRAPGLVNIDFSLFKSFRPVERVRIEFRAEAYNLANHPTWAAPGTTINDPANFGKITSASGNRTVQLALKLYF
jgi:hypothetical protein